MLDSPQKIQKTYCSILSNVASSIGLHHIPRTVPSIVLIIPTVNVAITIYSNALALSFSFEPVTHEVGIDSTLRQTL